MLVPLAPKSDEVCMGLTYMQGRECVIDIRVVEAGGSMDVQPGIQFPVLLQKFFLGG